MMEPMPGWMLIRRPQLDARNPGGRLIIPASHIDRFARQQFEVVDVAQFGTRCDDEDCDRWHQAVVLSANAAIDFAPATRFHLRPKVEAGDWVVTLPRSIVPIPGVEDVWLCPIDNLVCVLEDQ